MNTQFDRYVVETKLGQGAMSTVYRALDTKLNRRVALKILHPHLLEGGNWVARFEEEAKMLAKISHPNVTQVYDFGMRDNQYFIALELIEGMDFASLLKQQSSIPWEISSILFSQIAGGLHHVHQNNIIHRDIKLANLLLQDNGNAKISDFSISKSEEAISLTALDQIPGTPSYIAPELICGERPSVSTDIFAFGVAFYQTLTGVPPFYAKTVAALFDKIRQGNFASLESKGVFVPRKLSDLITNCLKVVPEERYASMHDIVEKLNEILSNSSIRNDPSFVKQYLKSPKTAVESLRSQTLKEALAQAKKLKDEGKIFDSLNAFKKVLGLDPTNQEAEDALRTFPAQQGSTDITMVVPKKKSRVKFIPIIIVFIVIASFAFFFFYNKKEMVEQKNEIQQPEIKQDTIEKAIVVPENEPAVTKKPQIKKQKNEKHVTEIMPEPVIETKDSVVVPTVAKPCFGQLTLYSSVWAYIYIDGEKRGIAPAKAPFELACGKHQIEFRRPNGQKYISEIELTSEHPVHLSIQEKDYR